MKKRSLLCAAVAAALLSCPAGYAMRRKRSATKEDIQQRRKRERKRLERAHGDSNGDYPFCRKRSASRLSDESGSTESERDPYEQFNGNHCEDNMVFFLTAGMFSAACALFSCLSLAVVGENPLPLSPGITAFVSAASFCITANEWYHLVSYR